MNNLQDTSTECHVCNGAGYVLANRDLGTTTVTRKCSACNGTGLTKLGEELEKPFRIGICPKCDRPMTHYRLRGYVCPYCERTR